MVYQLTMRILAIINISKSIQNTCGFSHFVMEIARAQGAMLPKAGGICYNYTDAE